jgi:hypothetical protein
VPDSQRIVPRCLTGVGHYVSADGHYYPCCWAENATTYAGSLFETHRDQLDLAAHSLDEVLASEAMRLLVASWERFEDAPRACQCHCGVAVKDDGTASPWNAQPVRENISLRKPGGKR